MNILLRQLQGLKGRNLHTRQAQSLLALARRYQAVYKAQAKVAVSVKVRIVYENRADRIEQAVTTACIL